MKKAKLEICLSSIDDIKEIDGLDYDRIELNSALELGGLTPSISLLKKAKEITDKPIISMVRSRGSNFIYSDDEKEVMYNDAKLLIDNGTDGLVFGFLNEDYTIDTKALKIMKEIVKDKELVFHKAFDLIDNKEKAIETLIEYGINRILLMNEKNEEIEDALKRIRVYNELYGDKITFLPGGGVTEENILHILDITNSKEIHGTFKKVTVDQKDGSTYINTSRSRVANVIDKLKV